MLAQVLPSGFGLPPLPYAVGLGMAVLVVGVLLVLLGPPMGSWDVLALAPWMALGATFHVLHEVGAFPPVVDPLFGAPSVYGTTFAVAGVVWLFATVGADAGFFASVARLMGVVGTNALLVFVVFLGYLGFQSGTIAPLWPGVALLVSVVVAGLAFVALSVVYTDPVATTGTAGAFVVFGHTLDGVSTAVGVDVLGASERSPVPRAIMEFAADLPTAELLGVGWLFVVVKVALALVVLALFTDLVREEPYRGNALLAAVAAVGFGPGFYNVLLYLVGALGA